MLFAVEPLSGALGAEIKGLDLSRELDERQVAALREAWREHLVLVFRDQDLEPGGHVALARRLGTPHIHPFVQGLPDHPEVIEIVKEPEETNAWGAGWHSDVSFEECPSLGSLLHAKEIPPFGGDTVFANMELAYDTLDDAMKERLSGLRAQHSSGAPARYADRYRGMRPRQGEASSHSHPVVRIHPETGRKILFVNPIFTHAIEGLEEAESATLLRDLIDHATRLDFTCRIRWAPRTLVMWDNRSVMHNALTDFFTARGNTGHRRVMHRVTLQGDRPR